MKQLMKRNPCKVICNKCGSAGRKLWECATRQKNAKQKYGLRPKREPLLPQYFTNVGLTELGWKNRLYNHILYGSWTAFLISLLLIILMATCFFWIPIYIIFSMDRLSITNVKDFWDTIAIALSILLNILPK